MAAVLIGLRGGWWGLSRRVPLPAGRTQPRSLLQRLGDLRREVLLRHLGGAEDHLLDGVGRGAAVADDDDAVDAEERDAPVLLVVERPHRLAEDAADGLGLAGVEALPPDLLADELGERRGEALAELEEDRSEEHTSELQSRENLV